MENAHIPNGTNYQMSKDNDENKQNSGEKKYVQITTKGKTHMEKIE